MKPIDILFITANFILTILLLEYYMDEKFEECKTNQSIYFEYKIINSDTIPIDTVFIQRIEANGNIKFN